MNHSQMLYFFVLTFMAYNCCARVGVYSKENDSITVKMLNPGYIFNTLTTLCLKLDTDIDLLVEHEQLYEEWITKSDYLLDEFLELYTYVCYVLLFKYEMHSYLQEDTAPIINVVKRVMQRYLTFVNQKQERIENIHCIFLTSMLKKIGNKTLLLINLTKEVCIPFYDPL